jgi:hypothetical protein
VEVSVARPIPSDEPLFTDGLGDRLLVRDARGRPVQETLVLRPELSGVPSFEFALTERMWLFERFEHTSFLRVRNIVRTPAPGSQVSLISDYVPGPRLSDVLAHHQAAGEPPSLTSAAELLKSILDGLGDLHQQSGDLAHGALAPERIIVTDRGPVITDYVLGAALEQLRFPPDRYWRELRVAVPSLAGGTRLDRRTDVAQVGMVAVALFAGRPLDDNEHMAAISEVLRGLTLPSPLRTWLMKALHLDPRRVFANAGEAARNLDEVIAEAGLRPAAVAVETPQAKSFQAAIVPPPVAPPKQQPPVAAVRPPAVASLAPDDWQRQAAGGINPVRTRTVPPSRFKKYILSAVVAAAMAGMFTAAQFLPPPDWLFARTGTLVIESNPQGVPVFVNGNQQGVTPLTLKVAGGRHEVELRGPGKPRIFNVFVSRGDRVAQYVEFPSHPTR